MTMTPARPGVCDRCYTGKAVTTRPNRATAEPFHACQTCADQYDAITVRLARPRPKGPTPDGSDTP
jgi:hypothetical protein